MNVTKIEIESRKPCCNRGWRQKDSAEHERYGGALIDGRITENNITNADRQVSGLLEEIVSPRNLNKAYLRVKRNKGAGGVDGMGVDELLTYLRDNGEELRQTILDGRYHPKPVRRVEIPKDNGKTRKLGIPTAVDRVIQQAIAQVLTPIYEPKFVQTSYGFRPKRSAHDAIRKCQEYINSGYKYAVDMDLEKFFDTVNQSKLMEVLATDIKDGRVLSLIHRYLRAGVVVNGMFEDTELGVPQGGPLSPLCANIMLNELDHELERRGHIFVRYADDMVILCKSKRSAQRTLENVIPFIEKKLFLKVNREKTTVAYVGKIKFLGYSFYKSPKGAGMRVYPKSIAKMKAHIKVLTQRSDGLGYEQKKLLLKQYITGWVNYFKLADMKGLLEKTDEWMRRRIRMFIWKQWKKVRTRFAMLRKLGIAESNVGILANTRKGYWRIANSPILVVAISRQRLKQAGYLNFLDYYESVRA